jgi:hypothetical protein
MACLCAEDAAALILPLSTDVAAHASLSDLRVYATQLDTAVLDALVDAALSLPLLRTVRFKEISWLQPVARLRAGSGAPSG